jgi:hypothetical protein
MFRKPGAATCTLSMAAPKDMARRLDASASAICSGDRRMGRASFMARLVARSPCSGLAGRSTSTSGA